MPNSMRDMDERLLSLFFNITVPCFLSCQKGYGSVIATTSLPGSAFSGPPLLGDLLSPFPGMVRWNGRQGRAMMTISFGLSLPPHTDRSSADRPKMVAGSDKRREIAANFLWMNRGRDSKVEETAHECERRTPKRNPGAASRL